MEPSELAQLGGTQVEDSEDSTASNTIPLPKQSVSHEKAGLRRGLQASTPGVQFVSGSTNGSAEHVSLGTQNNRTDGNDASSPAPTPPGLVREPTSCVTQEGTRFSTVGNHMNNSSALEPTTIPMPRAAPVSLEKAGLSQSSHSSSRPAHPGVEYVSSQPPQQGPESSTGASQNGLRFRRSRSTDEASVVGASRATTADDPAIRKGLRYRRSQSTDSTTNQQALAAHRASVAAKEENPPRRRGLRQGRSRSSDSTNNQQALEAHRTSVAAQGEDPVTRRGLRQGRSRSSESTTNQQALEAHRASVAAKGEDPAARRGLRNGRSRSSENQQALVAHQASVATEADSTTNQQALESFGAGNTVDSSNQQAQADATVGYDQATSEGLRDGESHPSASATHPEALAAHEAAHVQSDDSGAPAVAVDVESESPSSIDDMVPARDSADTTQTKAAAENNPSQVDMEEGADVFAPRHDTSFPVSSQKGGVGEGTIRRRKLLCCLVLVLLFVMAVVGIAIGVVMSRKTNDSQEDLAGPTLAPTRASVAGLFLDDLPEDTLLALDDTSSAQFKANQWLFADPDFPSYSEARLLQRFALATLYHAVGGKGWSDSAGWLSYDDHECDWFSGSEAAVCNENDQYQRLVLPANRLRGPLPAEIFQLSSLLEINLRSNKIYEVIPTEIGHTFDLKILDLSNNDLEQEIPSEIGLLFNLQTLMLAENQLRNLPFELGNCQNLVTLDVENNKVSDIPFPLGNLNQLEVLNLSLNLLSTTITTTIGQLTQLQSLTARLCGLQGPIPTEIGMMQSLRVLSLGVNRLSGTLPTELSQNSQIEAVYLYDNKLSGTLISEFGLMKRLSILQLFSNALSSTIPPVAIGGLSELSELGLAYNAALTGVLPSEIAALSKLRLLAIEKTGLVGSVPDGLCPRVESGQLELTADCSQVKCCALS